MKINSLLLLAICVVVMLSSSFVLATPYFGYESYGGTWHDAEKSLSSSEDDLMCWAATTANMLTYSGWGFPVGGGGTTDEIFAYYQDHWTDAGGNMFYGTQWWFSGTNGSQGQPGWSQVDVPGGGFYSDDHSSDYYAWTSFDLVALEFIDEYLHDGRGVGLSVGGPGGHAITAWGYEYDKDTGDYLGIYVTDSDDDKYGHAPRPDRLRYYEVSFDLDRWYLENFYGSNSWYITEVHGLLKKPASPIPEPSTILLFGIGVLGIAGLSRKQIKQ